MQTQNIPFHQILRLRDCELWKTKEGHTTCPVRGPVQILYANSINMFVLRIEDYYWDLEKTLQITAIFSEKEHLRSYMISSSDIFYTIKVIEPESEPTITNFETILENTTTLLRRGGLEQELGTEGTTETTSSEGLHSFSKTIERAEETIKSSFQKVGQVLTRAFSHGETHPNYTMIRSFNDLKTSKSSDLPVVDIPYSEIEKLRSDLSQLQVSRKRSGDRSDVTQHIAGTGLTSQSMGTDDTKHPLNEPTEGIAPPEITTGPGLHRMSSVPVEQNPIDFIDQQETVGPNLQRLPSYEVEHSRGFIARGLRKASFNLGAEQKPVPEVVDEEDFTTNLMCGTCKVDHHGNPIDPRKHPEYGLEETGSTDTSVTSNLMGGGSYTLSQTSHPICRKTETEPKSFQENYDEFMRIKKEQQEGGTASQPLETGGTSKPGEVGTVGKENIMREKKEQGSTKHKKVPTQPLDKENVSKSTIA
jgi:hypothetical protein